MKSKKVFKINILNPFFITVLNYQIREGSIPIPALLRLEAESALDLEASLIGFNKPLNRDDPIGKVLRVNTNSRPFTCLAQGK